MVVPLVVPFSILPVLKMNETACYVILYLL